MFPNRILNKFKLKSVKKELRETDIFNGKKRREILECYTDNDKKIAILSWFSDDIYVVPVESKVEEDYQRQGIATALYDAIRIETGKKLKWSYIQDRSGDRKMDSGNIKAFSEKYKMYRKGQIEREDDFFLILKEIIS